MFDVRANICWNLAGPGPAPQLDNGNIVFGTVLEGQFPSHVPSCAQETVQSSSQIVFRNGIACTALQ